MPTATYQSRRGELETYFDRTAVEAWTRLTSDAPVSRIRATVRAGRDAMRATLLDWLPADLSGRAHPRRRLRHRRAVGRGGAARRARGGDRSVADAGRPRPRTRAERPGAGRIDFAAGDMLDPALGEFDHVVAMDSLIHYHARDIVRVLADLAGRTHAGDSLHRSRRARRRCR